jgi:hypothetical protein
VADALNRDGVPAPSREKWIRGRVLQIARRRAYPGRLAWGIKAAPEPARRCKPARPGMSKKSSYKRRPEAEWIYMDVPPIIDAVTFERAQQALAANRKMRWRTAITDISAYRPDALRALRSAAATRMVIRTTSAAEPIRSPADGLAGSAASEWMPSSRRSGAT